MLIYKHKIGFWLLISYSLLVPLLRALSDSGSFNVILSTLSDVLVVGLIVALFDINKIKSNANILDISVSCFVGLSIISGFGSIIYNVNYPELFFYGLHMTVLPIIAYYGTRFSNVDDDKVMNCIWLIGLLHIIIGILLYEPVISIMPTSLQSILSDINLRVMQDYEDNFGLTVRMRSTLGPLEFGNIAGITAIITFYRLLKDGKITYGIIQIITLVAVALSFQRSAWVGTACSLMFMLIFIRTIHKIKVMIYFGGIIFVVAAAVQLILPDTYINYFQYRIDDVLSLGENAISSRSDQWDVGLALIKDYPLGLGIGQLGHKALLVGVSGIADGNYFKLLSEIGVLGFAVFISVLIIILTRFIINFYCILVTENNILLISFIIIAYYMLQAIGTNVWDLYYVSVVFWMFVGLYCRNSSKLQGRYK